MPALCSFANAYPFETDSWKASCSVYFTSSKSEEHLLLKIIKHVQIQSFDVYMLVISLAIRQWSEDLKHLISGNGPPEIQG